MVVKKINFPSAESFIGTAVTAASKYNVHTGAYTIGIEVVAVNTIDRSFTIAGSITEEGNSVFPVSIASKKIAYTEHLFKADWQNQDVAKWYNETVEFLNAEFKKYIEATYLTVEDTKEVSAPVVETKAEEIVVPAEEVTVVPEVTVAAEEPVKKKFSWSK